MAEQAVVDVDADLLALVQTILPSPGERMRVHVADGLEALGASPAGADLVILDVFVGDETPDHLTGGRVAESARPALSASGALIIDLADSGDLGASRRQAGLFAQSFPLHLPDDILGSGERSKARKRRAVGGRATAAGRPGTRQETERPFIAELLSDILD